MLVKLIKNVGALTLGEILSKALGFVATIMLARGLGEAQFGQYAYAVSVITILAVVNDFGLSTVMVKDISRETGLAAEYLGKGVAIRLVLACACVAAAVLTNVALGFDWELILVIFIFSLSLPFQSLALSCQAVFQALEKMEYIGVMLVARNGLSLALILGALSVGYSVGAVVLAQTISFAVVALIALYVLKNMVGAVRLRYPPGLLVSFGRKGLPFLYIAALYMLYYKADVVMLQMLKGETQVGWYSAGYELVLGFYMIPTILSTVLFPVFSKQSATSLDDLRQSCGYTLKFLVMVAVPLAAGLCLLAEEIIPLLYGDRYMPAAAALQVLALAFVVYFPNMILSYVLTAIEKVRELVRINVFGLCVNVVLNVVFIQLWGFVGASLATVASLAVVMLACYWRLTAHLGHVPLFGFYVKPALAVASVVAAIDLVGVENVFAITAAGGVLYLLCLAALQGVSREEILMIKTALTRRLAPADS